MYLYVCMCVYIYIYVYIAYLFHGTDVEWRRQRLCVMTSKLTVGYVYIYIYIYVYVYIHTCIHNQMSRTSAAKLVIVTAMVMVTATCKRQLQ